MIDVMTSTRQVSLPLGRTNTFRLKLTQIDLKITTEVTCKHDFERLSARIKVLSSATFCSVVAHCVCGFRSSIIDCFRTGWYHSFVSSTLYSIFFFTYKILLPWIASNPKI